MEEKLNLFCMIVKMIKISFLAFMRRMQPLRLYPTFLGEKRQEKKFFKIDENFLFLLFLSFFVWTSKTPKTCVLNSEICGNSSNLEGVHNVSQIGHGSPSRYKLRIHVLCAFRFHFMPFHMIRRRTRKR